MKNLTTTLLFLTALVAVSCNSESTPTKKETSSAISNSVRLNSAKIVESKIPAEELILTKKQKRTYKRLLRSPRVTYLRNAVDRYRAEKTLNTNPVFEKENTTALKDINKNDISGKFLVFSENLNPMGGANIELMFQGHTDKVYNAWIYDLGKGVFTLRSFTVAPYYTTQDVKNIQIRYKRFLKDPEYAR